MRGDAGSQNNASIVTATASQKEGGTAVTLVNRHYNQPASVTLNVPATSRVVSARLLAADDPRAVNSAAQPDRVAPAALNIGADGANTWRVELPPHSMATVEFA